MATTTYRDKALRYWPWSKTGLAARILYAMASQLDSLADMLFAGMRLRFPGLYSDESLGLIGRERRMRRGLAEDATTYSVRLRSWLIVHSTRGNPYAMLTQLYLYLAPAYAIHLRYRSGRVFVMAADGTITRSVVSTPNQAQWSRWTLLLWTDSLPPPLSNVELQDLAIIPKEWNAAHCIGRMLIMPTGAELWDYPATGRTWDESGTWDTTAVTRIDI